ncbi:MAG: hypothetical protein HRT44_12260 [Bdellovibrionales bacterium]|nr:hypothetical protein [Bdellovibrionales bacterium]NQZ20012.1 hypothetical protein [Bdellovibrionales bacterium]
MTWQKVAIYSILLIAAWKGLHYLFLWMESKGWIYYKNKPSGSGVGNALQELNSFMNPAVKEVLERKFEHKEEDKAEDLKK